jgi:hypothetical protein
MKRINQKWSSFVLIGCLVAQSFVSCKRDPMPRNALEKEKFIEVMIDVHLAEAIYNERQRLQMDTLFSDALYRSVLEKHKVNAKDLEATILYYSRHPKEYDKIFNEMLSRISEQTEELNKEKEINISKE